MINENTPRRPLSVEEAAWLIGVAEDLEAGLEHFEWGTGGTFGEDPDDCDPGKWVVDRDHEGNIELHHLDSELNEYVPFTMDKVCACAIGMVAARRAFIITSEDHAYEIFIEDCPTTLSDYVGGEESVNSKVFGRNDRGIHPNWIAWVLRETVSKDDLNIFNLDEYGTEEYIRREFGLPSEFSFKRGEIPNATR